MIHNFFDTKGLKDIKLIIAGSRTITDIKILKKALKSSIYRQENVCEIVSGKARGVDTLGEEIAEEWGIPVIPFPANWEKYGMVAGFKRNKEMGIYASDALIVWNGVSNGSLNMYKQMKTFKKPVHIFNILNN